jgi:phosphatidyl-myo-inositol alpha-mannosyltransferase
MRIALTHAFCWPEVRRGGERFVPSLGAALVRRGHDVTFFSASRHPGRRRERGVRIVRFGRLFEDQHRHELHFGLRMLPRLATDDFDVVHSFGRHDAVASILARRLRHSGRLTVFSDLGNPDRDWWRTQGFVQSRAVDKVVADVDIYSCFSQFALDTLASTYGRTDGALLPGGVELAAFVPAEARQMRPTILFSGAFAEPRKGVADLLEALPIIAAPGDAGPLLAAAPEEARRRVRVLGLGDVDRQHERYGRAWVTCLPSTDEAFGLALLESLACGTPVVATDHAAPKELIREGVTGELCAPHEPGSLAAACLRALALARRPGTAQRCRDSAAPYDFDTSIAPRCERIYQRS